MKFLLLDVLDLLEDLAFVGSRPSYGRLAGYWGYAEMRAAYRAFQRWEEEQYLEKTRQGNQVLYRLGPAGKKFLQQHVSSPALRWRKWDGRWRMVMFDFPEVARKARDAFRCELRRHRMGCLQKSVWITPDPVIPAWKRLLAQTELTDWVLLFESAELGPVEDVEIARKVWPLDRMSERYNSYLSTYGNLPSRLKRAKSSSLLGELGEAARRESRTYFDLLKEDPLLPVSLLPKEYPGLKADALHQQARAALRACVQLGKP